MILILNNDFLNKDFLYNDEVAKQIGKRCKSFIITTRSAKL